MYKFQNNESCSSWATHTHTQHTHKTCHTKTGITTQYQALTLFMSRNMWLPTMWYVRPGKTQASLSIQAVWSEPLWVAWIFCDSNATDQTSFGVSKLKMRLHRLVWVYTCQNATLFEITCRGSYIYLPWEMYNLVTHPDKLWDSVFRHWSYSLYSNRQYRIEISLNQLHLNVLK